MKSSFPRIRMSCLAALCLFSAQARGQDWLAAVDDNAVVRIGESNGAGEFANWRVLYSFNQNYTYGIRIGNFDRDGYPDIITGYMAGQVIYIFKFPGQAGGFGPPQLIGSFPDNNGYVMGISAGDFNEDGAMDFVVFTNGTNSAVFLSNRNGSFTGRYGPWGTNAGRHAHVADFNRDGHLDILGTFCCNGQNELYLGDGTGNFAFSREIGRFGGNAYANAVADFNQDGIADLISGGDPSGDLRFFAGNGDGTFRAPVPVNVDVNNHCAIDAFDYDKDGNADLVMTTYTTRTVYVAKGLGTGQFGPLTAIGSTGNSLGISAMPNPDPILPVAVISPPFQTSAMGQPISLDGTPSRSPGGMITGGSWDLGDGTLLQGLSINHAYAAKGRYLPTLTITDALGRTSTGKAYMDVTGPPPVAEAGGPYQLPESDAQNGLWTGQVDGSASSNLGGGESRYLWDFRPARSLSEDFDQTPLNSSVWRQSGIVIQNGKLRLGPNVTSTAWGSAYLQSEANFGREPGLACYLRYRPTGAEYVMFGFKNTGTDAGYPNLFHAFYDSYGGLYIYEAGTARGRFRNLVMGNEYDFLLRMRQTGAEYWFKPAESQQWELIYTSSYQSGSQVKFGMTLAGTGQNEFDNIRVGQIAEGIHPVYPYWTGPETDSVTLTVIDWQGQAAKDSTVVTTLAGAPPVAVTGGPYLYDEHAALNGQWVAHFDGSRSTDDNGISDYAWNFGDGITGTGVAPVHTYAGRGPYTVRLVVRDHAGLSDTDETLVGFTPNNPPVAGINGPDVIDESAAHAHVWTATFNAGTSSDDVGLWRFEWSFGDGASGTGTSVSHGYADSGTYTVTLRAFDHAGQSAQTTRQIRVLVNQSPIARITGPDTLREISSHDGIWTGAFGAGSSSDDHGIWRYEWDFGNGTTSTAANPSVQFNAPGVYPLRLTAFDNAGQSNTVIHNLVVKGDGAPVAVIHAAPAQSEGLPVHLDALASTDDFGISRYLWNLGTTAFEFEGAQINPVLWQVRGAVAQDGAITSQGTAAWGVTGLFSSWTVGRGSSFRATVRIPSAPQGNIMIGWKNLSESSNYVEYPYAIEFVDGGRIDIYEGGTRRGQVSTHQAGVQYEARIDILENQGARYYLRPAGSAAWSLIYQSSYSSQGEFRFGYDHYNGTFAMDRVEIDAAWTGPEFSYTPLHSGPVRLIVRDNGQLEDTAFQDIALLQGSPPVARIAAPATGGIGLEMPFNAAASTDDHGIARYEWDFGDGSPPRSGPQVSHAYANAGSYVVTLVVRDFANQAGSATRTVTVDGEGLVRCIPWQIIRGVEAPHETWSGKSIHLKAVASTAALPFNYSWDFGDGSAPVTGTVTTRAASYALEATHAYTGSAGTPFFAHVTITGPGTQSGTDTYPIVLLDKTLNVEVNVAIDEGLWFLHKNQTQSSYGGEKSGYWTSYGGYWINVTASAAQSFLISGHSLVGDPKQDPYVETVQRAFTHLSSAITYWNIGAQAAGDPDANHNGLGLGAASDHSPYETGALMDAFVASGLPEYRLRTGGTNVSGRTLRDIVQDMADLYAWGQSDGGWSRGGWRYSWNADADNSGAQWGAIGLLPAERIWHLVVPDFVKTENRIWTNYSYSCGFGYTGGGHTYPLTPSGMVQLAFNGTTTDQTIWTCPETRMSNEWSSFMSSNANYGFFAFAKAMRLASPAPVTLLRPNNFDWFWDPNNGMARTLVNTQYADGSWLSSHPYPSNYVHNTAWSIIILTPTLFENPPVARATASPLPGAIGQPITFDGSGSYHLDPSLGIASYAWDFDASDGVDWTHPDATGPIVTHAYPDLKNYTATLRVGDNRTPPTYVTATVNIPITIPPHPPTSVPGGPYVGVVGEPLTLNGSGSFDIDQPDGDSITAYGWEINLQNPRDFNDAVGARPTGISFASPGAHSIGLRVTDNTARVFPQAGRPNLTNDAYATVNIENRCLDNLAARAKVDRVALTWTHDGSSLYTVQRSAEGPNWGYETIGTTASTYSTYIDYNVQTNVPYYYRVRSANGCASPVVSITPRFRIANHRPAISSVPVTTAQERQPYAYDVDAQDLDGQTLTYFLDEAPGGMTIDAATGLIRWTPADGQAGLHTVSVRASDGSLSAVQSFLLNTAPRPNQTPLPTIAMVDSALQTAPVFFDAGASTDPDGDLPLQFQWNFGDGHTATGTTASHAYAAAGTYVITLFATDARGATANVSRTLRIGVPNHPPEPALDSLFMIAALDSLSLDASKSIDPDGDSLAFTWNFGDDTPPLTGPVARHAYAEEGVYFGSLQIEDGHGAGVAVAFRVIATAPNHPPVADFTVSPSLLDPGQEALFDARGTFDPDGDAVTFSWDFGDGVKTTGAQVSHVFGAPGHFNVTLTALDARGKSATASHIVHVNAPPSFAPLAAATIDEDVSWMRTLDASDPDGDPLSFALVSGPPGMGVDAASGHLIWTPDNGQVGSHRVIVRVSDGRLADQDTFLVVVNNVNDPPVFTSAPALSVTELQSYGYQAQASDVDAGDILSFSLRQAPQGMTVDAASGLVSWVPGHGQVGPNAVILRVTDAAGAFAEQPFTVAVGERPWRPHFTSTPPTTATQDEPYAYHAQAADSNSSDLLIYQVLNGPPGLEVNALSGLVAWTPKNADVGTATVRLQVSDGALADTQAFAIAVANVNDPPAFVSTPVTGAALAAPYRYQAEAVDPDVGDHLTFALPTAPTGAVVNATTGLVTWQPSDTGTFGFVLQVSDASNASVRQTYSVHVVDSPLPPVFTSTPVTHAVQDQPYAYQATGSDPNGDALAFGLKSGPVGLTVTPAGAVAYTPTWQDVGTHPVRLFITDGIDTVFQQYYLAVENVNDAPTILSSPPLTVVSSQLYAYQVQAEDRDGDSLRYILEIAPQGMAVSATGLISWPAGIARDTAQVRLLVRDGHGGDARQEWLVRVIQVSGPLTAHITSPDTLDTLVTSPLKILGTASGIGFDHYTLDHRAAGTSTWIPLVTGAFPISDGELGTFDPTLLPNGIYEVRLAVLRGDGSGETETRTIVVDGGMKLGQLNFAKTDLTLKAPGMDLALVREYDSRRTEDGDFGPGWNLASKSVSVASTIPLGENWTEFSQDEGCVFGICAATRYRLAETRPHTVVIRLSDAEEERFGLEVDPASSLDVPYADLETTLRFKPLGKTLGTLEAVGGTDHLMFDGDKLNRDGEVFDPHEYKLTLRDGTVYMLNTQAGLQSMTDPHGNTVTYAPNAITHSSGASISIDRDGSNHIVRTADNQGRVMRYEYENGVLARVLQEGAGLPAPSLLERYGMLPASEKHKLKTIQAPDGRDLGTFEYDGSGRLIGLTDADGNRVIYGYDVPNHRQCVADRLGHQTCYEYDNRGNVTRKTDPLDNVTRYEYDDMDHLLRETGPTGIATNKTYNASGDVLSEIDGLGNTTRFEYDAGGRVTRTQDPLGHVTLSTYDSQGDLTTSTDASGNVTRYAYDASGNQTSMTDAAGNVIRSAYDASGNLTHQIDATGQSTDYTYDAFGNQLSETRTRTTPAGPVAILTRNVYDAKNRLVKSFDANGDSTQTEYNDLGKQTASIDKAGRRTEFHYDPQGNQVRVIHPDGTSDSTVYDAEGRRTVSIDILGRETRFEYDILGRLVRTEFSDHTSTSTVYDALGRTLSSTDVAGSTTQYEYENGCGCSSRRTGVIDALNHATHFEYDASGNQTAVIDANGHRTEYVYDALNRRVKTLYADGTSDSTGYDALGRNVYKRDQAGVATRYQYDALGHLVKVIDALNQETRYGYDEMGNQITQIDALGRTTRFEYDNLGRRIHRRLPLGQVESFTYDASGNMATKTDFNGHTTSYSYDLLGRLIHKTPDPFFAGHPGVGFTYTQSGQRETMSDASGLTRYFYDGRDRLTRKETPEGTLFYGYDAAGRLASIHSENDSGVSVEYGYDALGRLSAVNDKRMTNGITTYSYDPSGNLAGYVYPNGVETNYQYNTLNRLVHMEVNGNAPLARYDYTLSPTGNRLSVAELNGRFVQYHYDDLYRLTQESISGDESPNLNGNITYVYDAVGNRLSRTSEVGPVPTRGYGYNDNDQLLSDTYDANGNTLVSGGKRFTWDFENRLVGMDSGDVHVAMVYDGDGNRMRKTVGGVTTEFLVDDRNLTGYAQVLEERGGDVVQLTYQYGLNLINQRRKGASKFDPEFLAYDGHNNARLLFKFDYSNQKSFKYEAFGKLLDARYLEESKYLYSGQQFDSDIDKYFLRSRYLSVDNGTFLSFDSYNGMRTDPETLHKYAYAQSNPIDMLDPSGHFAILTLASGAIISSTDLIQQRSELIQGYVATQKAKAVTSVYNAINSVRSIISNAKIEFRSNGFKIKYKVDRRTQASLVFDCKFVQGMSIDGGCDEFDALIEVGEGLGASIGFSSRQGFVASMSDEFKIVDLGGVGVYLKFKYLAQNSFSTLVVIKKGNYSVPIDVPFFSEKDLSKPLSWMSETSKELFGDIFKNPGTLTGAELPLPAFPWE